MDETDQRGGFDSTALGFLGGAAVFTAANWFLARHGAEHRKRSGSQQPSEGQDGGSCLAIAVGSVLDSVPESVVIGLSLLGPGVPTQRDVAREGGAADARRAAIIDAAGPAGGPEARIEGRAAHVAEGMTGARAPRDSAAPGLHQTSVSGSRFHLSRPVLS